VNRADNTATPFEMIYGQDTTANTATWQDTIPPKVPAPNEEIVKVRVYAK